MKTLKYQIVAWAALATIVFVTVSPIEMRPGDLFSVDLDRALAFGLLAAMFMVAYPRHALLVGSLIVLSAGAIELLQALSPTRHARLDDAVIKGSGALAGMVLATAYNMLRQIRHGRRPTFALPRLAISRVARKGDLARMTQMPVTSRLIEQVYFSQEDGQLRILFHNGEERAFTGVTEGDVTSLVSAPSPGKYYVEEIREKFTRAA
jgi:hypothetical protein